MTERLTIPALQRLIGTTPDGKFGPISRAALLAKFTNLDAPAITEADFAYVAKRWNVPIKHIKGVRKVEAPRGAYDMLGRPSILYERHKFRNNCVPPGLYNLDHPDLSGGSYGPGGYGSFASQYDKLAAACALDPEAAFRACSWGAFQVLGENAVALGYLSAFDMAFGLVHTEAAHLDMFVRFVETNNLVDKFRACRPGDPDSCIPFVSVYNGAGYRNFDYHTKLAGAIT